MKKVKKTNKQLTPQQALAKKKQKQKIIKICLTVFVLLVASAGIYLGFGIFKQVEGFSKEKLLNNESSIQVSANGEEYYSYGQDGIRKNVSYDDIPQVMIDAVVAAEDSRFFEHNGFDLPRIVKAFMGNLVAGRITGGGSTITQQVIKKSYYPKEEQTIERKAGEIILAIEATSQTTKQEILELYLNKIYFGYGNKAIGIYAASKYYFDKEVQNLTLPEAALLAGTLNSPNKYDPFKNLKLAQERRDTILDLMEMHGYISKEECAATKAVPVENTLKSNPVSGSGKYQAYADKVTREVFEKTGYDPNTTPMKITTYINTDLQSKLNDISNGDGFKFPDKYLQTGACVQESTTGRVIGVLAARDYVPMGTTYAYAASKENMAKSGNYRYGQRNQPGSSLKPIISYASAFEFLNYSTAHYVHDVPYSQGEWTPSNWDKKYHGDVSISEALSQSWNLAAIQTLKEVVNKIGTEKMTEYLKGFGFDMYNEKLSLGYAIGSWDTGISPEEQAAAYAVIANGGTYIEPHTVEKIELIETGEVINFDETCQKEKVQALSPESAFMIRDIMTKYVKAGTGAYSALNLGYQIGAKTGTSNHDKHAPNKSLVGKSKDLWMAAYSPDYSWSVWVGYTAADQKKGRYPQTTAANQISALIAKYVHKGGLKNSYPSKPSDVVSAQCISGIYPYVAPGSGVPSDRIVSGYFKKGHTPGSSANGAGLNNLTAFSAAFTNGKINVNFTEYDPKSMTESSTPTKVYTINGRSWTLPYLGDLSQVYGKVVYAIDITDQNGKIVHSEKLSTNTATLNYTPPAGTYKVTGYYAFESGEGTSNKINQTITVEGSTQPASYTPANPTATQMSYSVVVPSGSKITVSLNGQSQTLETSGTITFSNLSPATKYTVTFVETKANGDTQTLPSHEFTTSNQSTQ